MPRFVVRYRGAGVRPDEALSRVRSIGAKVLEDTGRMMLVEGAEQELRSALGSENDWVVSPEESYPIPDTREQIDRNATGGR